MYERLKCFWCGAEMRRGDDHHLWCANFPRDAAARVTKEGADHERL